MGIRTPDEMFKRELQKLYHAELEILDLHGDLSDAAGSDEIGSLFSTHREDTVAQINRIEELFDVLGWEPRARGSALMDGLVAEKDEFISEVESEFLRDIDVIAIGMINEQIEITLLDRLLYLGDELDFPGTVRENLEENRSEADRALRHMRSIADRRRFG